MAETEPLTELAYQAECGDARAQYRLGVLFLLGERVEQDLGAAGRWLDAAAANGNHTAEKIRNSLPAVPAKVPLPPSIGVSFAWLIPVLSLLLLSLHSGYGYRRTLNVAAHAAYSSPRAVVGLMEERGVPELQTQILPVSELAKAPDSAAIESSARKPASARHSKRRSHR